MPVLLQRCDIPINPASVRCKSLNESQFVGGAHPTMLPVFENQNDLHKVSQKILLLTEININQFSCPIWRLSGFSNKNLVWFPVVNLHPEEVSYFSYGVRR